MWHTNINVACCQAPSLEWDFIIHFLSMRETLYVELLLFRTNRSKLCWFGHMTRMSQEGSVKMNESFHPRMGLFCSTHNAASDNLNNLTKHWQTMWKSTISLRFKVVHGFCWQPVFLWEKAVSVLWKNIVCLRKRWANLLTPIKTRFVWQTLLYEFASCVTNMGADSPRVQRVPCSSNKNCKVKTY